MAITIAEKVVDVLDVLKHELQDAINQCACFVESLERQITPNTEDISYMRKMDGFSSRIQTVNRELSKYTLFKPELEQEVDQVDDTVEALADRFLKWARRKVINTTDAMGIFKRSRSTIYRWIRAGKLAAQKINGRWAIIV